MPADAKYLCPTGHVPTLVLHTKMAFHNIHPAFDSLDSLDSTISCCSGSQEPIQALSAEHTMAMSIAIKQDSFAQCLWVGQVLVRSKGKR